MGYCPKLNHFNPRLLQLAEASHSARTERKNIQRSVVVSAQPKPTRASVRSHAQVLEDDLGTALAWLTRTPLDSSKP